MLLDNLAFADSVPIVLTDPRLSDNPIVDCNEAFLRLTGYARDEVIGRNCRFLSGPGTDPKRRRAVNEAIKAECPIIVELLNYRKDGTSFLNSLMIAPVRDEGQNLIGFIGSQMEVPDSGDHFRKDRGEDARKRVAALSSRQKEVLTAVAKGTRIKRIAYELGLSERTVKMHRATLLTKLHVQSNAEAIRIAVEAGL